MLSTAKKDRYTGTALAILAVLIWSGNFIIARGVSNRIPPVSLAFYRWLTASVIIAPLAITKFKTEWHAAKSAWKYLFFAALTGVALFNTLVYIAGHYSTAIKLALIGTTSAPIMATTFAVIFLKEKLTPMRIVGMLISICGILFLLSKGDWKTLIAFRFSTGDWWILAGACMFAIYTILAKRKPASISPINFLFLIFMTGTCMLFPAYLWETNHTTPVHWDYNLLLVILYLGSGTSVIAYLCWNAAIKRLGAASTSLFGNLIPVFSIVEAMIILKEELLPIQVYSGLLVIGGLIIANIRKTTAPA